jgi:UDP-galactopyranose mutase
VKRIDDILVFSHLRWNFVYQRPQHLLTRLKRGRRILYVEEPLIDESAEKCGFRISSPERDLFVCTPLVPRAADASARVKAAIPELWKSLRPRNFACWFYTPMALPLAAGLDPCVTVYDCMDELSAFKNAPAELIEREKELLCQADLVFTGGESLYRAKRERHPNVHCFPSSVDHAHFSTALTSEDHPMQAGLGRPRLGYYGVIDERMDLEIVRALAEADPEWQIAMVGPVAKIDPAELPRARNLHYFGQRPYQELPAFLAGWDVCLMPFALNAATKHISPTKTLEYMAAEKMIVSTPIADVAGPYRNIVSTAEGPEAFVAACRAALQADDALRESRKARMRVVLGSTSWDRTVCEMERLMESAARRKSTPRRPRETGTLIIGAGPTGLSAAYHLGKDYALLDANSSVGGWCRSIEEKGFTFDYVGHIMFSNEPYVHRMYKILLGENVHWQDREAWIYSKGVYTRYPFQQSLHGLPADVIRECLVGAIEARFGPLQEKKANGTNGHYHVTDCCADGILEATADCTAQLRREPANFEEFIYRVWGRGIAKHFAIPYNRKLWAVPLHEMETSWLGGRVPLPDIGEMIEGAVSPAKKSVGPNARFGYPLRGGFQALMSAFLPHLKGELHLNSKVVAVSPGEHRATLEDGRIFEYDRLISTMPLPKLIEAMGSEVPASIRRAAAGLRYTSVRGVHIGVGRPDVTEKHWIYYPEDTVFHRIFVQGNASPYCNPPGGFGVTFEITYNENKPLSCEGDDLVELCIGDAKRAGFLREDDTIWARAQVDLPFAYVIYDHGRAERVRTIREWLRRQDILLAGRYGEWEYYNSDHAFVAGKKAAEAVREQMVQSVVDAAGAIGVAAEGIAESSPG